MSDKPTVEDTVRSVTGFDDIAVERMFGKELTDLSPVRLTRALVFVLKRRDGMNDADAFRACMEMGIGEVDGEFADDESVESIVSDLASGGGDQGKAPSVAAPKPGPTSS